MNEDNEKMNDKPIGQEKFDHEEPSECPQLPEDSNNYSRQDGFSKAFGEHHDRENKNKKEPLFVEDRTHNFTQEIEFEVFIHFLHFLLVL